MFIIPSLSGWILPLNKDNTTMFTYLIFYIFLLVIFCVKKVETQITTNSQPLFQYISNIKAALTYVQWQLVVNNNSLNSLSVMDFRLKPRLIFTLESEEFTVSVAAWMNQKPTLTWYRWCSWCKMIENKRTTEWRIRKYVCEGVFYCDMSCVNPKTVSKPQFRSIK